MYKIGQFSKITKISSRMLRYYDSENVLKLSFVDSNEYRFYTDAQIEVINKIKYLRRYHFSLDEIKDILSNNKKYDKNIYLKKLEELKNSINDYDTLILKIEFCQPIAEDKEIKGFEIKSFENTLCIGTVHYGGYESIHQAYVSLYKFASDNNYKIIGGFMEKYYVDTYFTKNNVKLKNGKNLGYQGSYMNFYIGNEVVLVPNYNDVNDKVANEIIQDLYSDREVIGIDIRELYKDGGMIHCVTQQQPINKK